MSKTRMLIVEDDMDIQHLLEHNIQSAGFEVLSAANGHATLAPVKKEQPQLFVPDLLIPGIDGNEVCKDLKRGTHTRDIPVILLTVKGKEIDRIVGLEVGADDYLVKPFRPRELVLRGFGRFFEELGPKRRLQGRLGRARSYRWILTLTG